MKTLTNDAFAAISMGVIGGAPGDKRCPLDPHSSEGADGRATQDSGRYSAGSNGSDSLGSLGPESSVPNQNGATFVISPNGVSDGNGLGVPPATTSPTGEYWTGAGY